jgi:hypothetical protein
MTDLYKVLPMTGALKKQYCPPKPTAKAYYPATYFLQQVTSSLAWTMDNEHIALSPAWLSAIKADIGAAAFKYWQTPSNGQWFRNGYNVCVFPGSLVNVIQTKYRPVRGGWWAQVQTIPYQDAKGNILPPPTINSLPDYLVSYQSDENYLGQVLAAKDDKGLLVRSPIMSIHPLWIFMDYLTTP